ncbi:MAG: glycosyltransferase [Gemmatimonadota bacterium]
MTIRRLGRIVGLFPGEHAGGWGGIQVSGMEAWSALREAARQEGGEARSLWYSQGALPAGVDPGPDAVVAHSRTVLAGRALGMRARVDVVLCWHLGLLPLLPLVAPGAPLVVLYLHGVEAWQPGSVRARRRLRAVDLVLTNTRQTWRRAAAVRAVVGDIRHRTVPLGIGAPLQVPTPPTLRTPVALMLGRLVRGEAYKGHREMIQVWPRVVERLPEAELWIAGDGDLRQELQALAARGEVPQRIRFWGRVDEATKERLLERAWCLALPSRNEGFGLVYAEAMRVGRPCLVGTSDGGVEVVQPPRAGLAADPADAEGLVEAMVELLRAGPAWERRSAAARLRYEAHFTAAAFHRRLLAVLRAAHARRTREAPDAVRGTT